ncbi:MAG: tRNA (adenosine(37)-N6)-threonylcarbamoyltransferase complex ATPase subunit type 1 TsaE [Gammaproteobacteria bacterium]|nr:tRNA (adenosine(37)-N6)-threonylcarbamoyltransferase complex ATPase subunit type 1 TsaE [Gammaproteobacteria bacterium]
MKDMNILLADEAATEKLGQTFAAVCPPRCLIFLYGDLGTGKTTFSRGFLRGLGYAGRVKSPTYTLLEPYEIQTKNERAVRHVYHLDLYRLADPEELAYLGVEDCFADEAISLVEWPQQGEGMLPPADVNILLQYQDAGRWLQIQAGTDKGRRIMQSLQAPDLQL